MNIAVERDRERGLTGKHPLREGMLTFNTFSLNRLMYSRSFEQERML